MKVRQYKDILLECLVTLRHARTFVTSREKMHRIGIELYDNLIVEVAEALSAPEPVLPATSDCDHKFRCNRHRDNPSNECCACGASLETVPAPEQETPAVPLIDQLRTAAAVCDLEAFLARQEPCEQCNGNRYLGDIPCSACNAMGESPAPNREVNHD